MKKHKKFTTKKTIYTGIAALIGLTSQTHAQSSVDNLLNKLEQKGILTVQEGDELKAEDAADQTNAFSSLPASKWKISDSIKTIGLYGDVRFRYEYRGADNVPGVSPSTYYRERFRYALRFGIRGDLYDDFSYGIRLETSTNPRSPWDTFGSNTTAGSVTPSDKAGSGIGIGQIFLNWHPTDWYEMTVGRMAMPLYTTPMVWDSDINPEGAFEKLKYTMGNVDAFADFGQFDYQDPSSASEFPSTDTFVLAWQAGALVHLPKDMAFKIAPMIYNYTGHGTSGGLNQNFVGQGEAGVNVGFPVVPPAGTTPATQAAYNEDGINDLLILEVPAEYDFKIPGTPLGKLQGRLFGDFAYNFEGDDRATAAYNTNPAAFPGWTHPATGNNKAYQIGLGVGSDGPVYGSHPGIGLWVYFQKEHLGSPILLAARRAICPGRQFVGLRLL